VDNVHVEVNTSAMMGNLRAKWRKHLPQITALIRENANRYVRVDRGNLRGSSYRASDLAKGRIVWETPYARRVYYTGKPSKDINPNASLLWCEVAKQRHSREWGRAVEKGVGNL